MDEDHPFGFPSIFERPTAISHQMSYCSLENAAVSREEGSSDNRKAGVGIRSAESLEEFRATINAAFALSGVVVDQLRTSIYSASTIQSASEGSEASSWQTECCMCMEEYKEGDFITSLPCKHFFHSGACPSRTAPRPEHPHRLTWKSLGGGRRPDCNVCNTFIPRGQHGWSCDPCDWTACSRCIAAPAEVPCGGLQTWLKRDQRCPMCRAEIRTHPKPERAHSIPWECPGCQVVYSNTHATCGTCGIRKVANDLMRGMNAGAFLVVRLERLVTEILKFRNRMLQLEQPKPADIMSLEQLKSELLTVGYHISQVSAMDRHDRINALEAWLSPERCMEQELLHTLCQLAPAEFVTASYLDKRGLILRMQKTRYGKLAHYERELKQRISSLSRSHEIKQLPNPIANAVIHMLKRLLEGDMEIPFTPGSMPITDVDQCALYMLVTDVVRATLTSVCQSEDLVHADTLLGIVIERPKIAAAHAAIELYRQQSRYQSCPFCGTSLLQHTRATTRRQACGCGRGFDLQHILLVNDIALDVFLQAEEIFQSIIAFDQSTSPFFTAKETSVPVPETLVETIRAFLTSPKMLDLDKRGLKLQSLFARVFTALLQRTSRTISLPMGYADYYSTCLFAVIWRKWQQQLEAARKPLSSVADGSWSLRLAKPSFRTQASENGPLNGELANWYFTTEQMQQQSFPGDVRAHRSLQAYANLMWQIVLLILAKQSNEEIDSFFFAGIHRLYPLLGNAKATVLRMRQGERELSNIVPDGLDSNSASALEALLRVLISLERLDFEAYVRSHAS